MQHQPPNPDKSRARFAQAATEVYGRPEILPRILDEDGRPATADDFREAFAWLRGHTDPQSAVVCSWWDYGYQLSAVARRATCVDNNTWNATHIGRVGLAFASPEGRAWELLRDLGATCVRCIFVALAFVPSSPAHTPPSRGDPAQQPP